MSEITDTNSNIEHVSSEISSSSEVSALNDVSSKNSDSKRNIKQQSMCVICHNNVARYLCPGCLAKTCSCACYKDHKEQTGCNGVRDVVPAALGNETPEEMLMRDCRFLDKVFSKLEQSYRNTKFHHIVPRKQERGSKRKRFGDQQEESNPLPPRMLYGKHNFSTEVKSPFKHLIPNYPYRQRSQDRWQPSRFDLSRPMKKLRYEARARQTTISFMSRGMSRHINNTSHFDVKCNAIRWCLRLVFIHADFYIERTMLHEDTTLGRVVGQVLAVTPPEELRVWSCTESNSGNLSKVEGATQNADTISGPLEEGWSEQSDNVDRCGSSDHDLSLETAPKVCNEPQVSIVNDDQPSSELSLSNNALKLIKVTKHTEKNSESKSIHDDSSSIKIANHDSKTDRNQPPLLPFQDLQLIEPYDVCTSTLNPFIQQPNPYELVPFKPLVKEVTPDPIAEASHTLTPTEADQFMFYQAAGLGELAVLFSHGMASDGRRYTQMDLTDTLKDNLAGLNVVEYPILLVMRKDHVYEFLDRVTAHDDHDYRRMHTKWEGVKKEQEPESNGLKYFDADCSFDDDQ